MKMGLSFLAVLSLWAAPIFHQQLTAQTDDALALITPDAVGMISVQPALIAKSKSLRRAPLEVITAAGLEYIGIDPLKLERIDVISGVPIPGPGGFPISICVTHGEPISQEMLSRFLPGGSTTEKGVELWAIPQTPGFVLALRNPKQAIIGPKAVVLRLVKTTPGEGELRKLVASLGSGAAAQFVVALEPLRALLVESAQMPQLQAIPDLVPNLKVVAEKARMICMRLEAGDAPSTTYLVEGTSPEDTVELTKAVKSLIRLGMKAGLEAMETELSKEPGKTPAATLAYAKRMSAEIESRLNFEPDGSRLAVKLEGQTMMIAQTGIAVGLLLPAVQASREAARRMSGSNNVKQIMLAFHNYADTRRSFVNDLGPDTRITKANLSWRVHLLPYIEEAALYNEFHLDEPWDSPHNIKLLERMPATYRDPRSNPPPGHTVYQMATGENMVHNPPKAVQFRDVVDGTSNTIAVFVVKDEAAVPWTKPEDLDPIAARDSIATSAGQFMVGMVDGSVMSLSSTIPIEALKLMVTINDGQEIDMKYFTR